MKKIKKDMAEFYKKIFSNAVLKNRIQEKAKKIVTEADLRKLIREDIMPLMKKEKLNCSEEELIEYEEETLKKLSKEALAGVSGGVSVKSAFWAGGILSMALFGSLNAHAMDVNPPALPEQQQIIQPRSNGQQQNNSDNANNNNANQPGNNGNNNNNDNDNNAANNNDRASTWRNTLYGLLNKLPKNVQKWAAPLIEKGLIVSDGNYLFFRNVRDGSISPLFPLDVTTFLVSPTAWDVNGNVYHANRISRFYGPGENELAEIEEIITYSEIENLTIAPRCFADNKKLRRVELKNVYNLTIEESAFGGCDGLSEIALNNFAKVTIGENAFAGCNSLDKELLKNKYNYVESPANNDNNINEPDDDDIAPSSNMNNDNNNNNANETSQHQDSNNNNAANVSASQNSNGNINNSNSDNNSGNNFSPISEKAYLENETFRDLISRLSDDVKNLKEFREAMKTDRLLVSGEFLLSFDPKPYFDSSFIYLYVPDDVSEVTINAEGLNVNEEKHTFSNYWLEKIYGGKNLKKIKLGSGLENFDFGVNCCEKRETLEEVDASGARNVKIINFAFNKCPNLKKFTGAKNTEIFGLAFSDCTSLCEVRVHANTYIHLDAFKGCTSLKGILPLKDDDNIASPAKKYITFRTILVPTANTCSPDNYEEIKIPAPDDYIDIVPQANMNNDNNNNSPANETSQHQDSSSGNNAPANINNDNNNNNNAYKEIKIRPTKEDLDKIISKWEATLSEEIKGNAYFKGIKKLILNVYETYLGTDEAEGMLTYLEKVFIGNQKNISIGANENFSTVYIFNKETGEATPILSLGITKLIISSPIVDVEGKTHDITLHNNILNADYDGPGKLKNLKELVVTNVPNFTFSTCCFHYSKNLEKVDVSGVVNLTIESFAFEECQKLYEVNINAKDSISMPLYLGSYPRQAFYNCYNLKQISLAAQTINIGEESFWNCINLEKVTFAGGNISIGLVAFRKCLSLKQIEFTKEPTSLNIANSAFDGCKNFNDPEFKKTCDIHKVTGSAFWEFGVVDAYIQTTSKPLSRPPLSASTILLPSDSDLQNINNNRPNDNDNDSLNTDCYSLLKVMQGIITGPTDNNENKNKNDIPDKHDDDDDDSNNNESVEEYDDEDYFVDIEKIMASQRREFGDNPQMRVLDRNAAMDMANGKIPCISKNAEGKIIFVIPIWCDVINDSAFDYYFDYHNDIADPEEQARFKKMIESVEILVVPPNVKEIAHWAFRGWPNLKKIIFIGGWPDLRKNRSFSDCKQLRKVESIGDSSNRPDEFLSCRRDDPFIGCDNLEELIIADNVICTRSIIFDNDDTNYGKKLRKLSMPKRAQIDFCENWCDNSIPIEDLHFPNGSSCKNFQIGNWNKLEKLDIPFVFNGLNLSKQCTLFENNERKLLIENCDLLTKVNIRGDVKAINVSTIDESGYSKTANVIYIQNCPKLEEVIFPSSLEDVCGACTLIDHCPSLKQITFLGERIYFEENFFYSNSDDSRNFPEGSKIYLPYAKEIYVGDKKYDIPNYNPNNRLSIVEIDYDERENYDKDVKIVNDENKRCFVFQKVLDKNEAELLLNGNIPGWEEESGILNIPNRYGEIDKETFENNSRIKTVVIPYSIKKVGKRAFANCFKLERVVFERDIPKLGEDAFLGYPKSEEGVVDEARKKAPSEQIVFFYKKIHFTQDFFNKLPKGEKIYLPYAKEIYVGDKKYDIPNYNPNNRLSIVEIDYDERENYDEDVEIVNDEEKRCFVFQKVLDKNEARLMLSGTISGWEEESGILNIPNRYGEIAEKAFENIDLLTCVDIPYSVKEVGKRAFAGSNNLKMITVRNSVPNFGENAFSCCPKLSEILAGGECTKTPPKQNLVFRVFSKCPNFKGLTLPAESGYDENKYIAFVTKHCIESWGGKNFGGIIIDNKEVLYFEKGFFDSGYLPVGFKIYLPEAKEVHAGCERISVTLVTKEGANSEYSRDEEDNYYCKYNVGEKIPIPEESLGKGMVLKKVSPEEKAKQKSNNICDHLYNNNWIIEKIEPNGKA